MSSIHSVPLSHDLTPPMSPMPIGPQPVTAWVTQDGEVFETYEQAARHEAKIEAAAAEFAR